MKSGSEDFYDIGSLLSPEEQAVRAEVRAFLDAEVRPIIGDYWDRGEFPRQLVPRFARFAELVLRGRPYTFPDPSPLFIGLLKLELGRCDPSICSFFSVHWGLAMACIQRFGSDDQRARWMGPLSRFEAVGSFALSEPLAGSDAAQGLRTVARRDGEHWVLDGEKKWSGNATIADVNVVFARDAEDGRVRAFLVELGMPGYEVTKLGAKLAKRAMDNVLIRLDGCRVPESARLPGVRGFGDVARHLMHGRALVSWEAAGVAQGAYEIALRYCREREQFGRPIAGFQLIQDKLVRCLARVTGMQCTLARLAQLELEGGMTPERAAMAKVICGEAMREAVALAREVMGGNGVLLEYEIGKLFADAEAIYTYEGTQEMNTLIVGRTITGISAFV
ncbi:MAG: acyl-CoA dehydrogenase family protein [Alphaproteobacteria bacterium]|nr:acyl-CoA dehydrogenase family protein [Alphaproteobacteria bacterium]MCB9792340.1 acyl-CoA dehydrogenase family protein [Alphaproteobacteria bacterium]